MELPGGGSEYGLGRSALRNGHAAGRRKVDHISHGELQFADAAANFLAVLLLQKIFGDLVWNQDTEATVVLTIQLSSHYPVLIRLRSHFRGQDGFDLLPCVLFYNSAANRYGCPRPSIYHHNPP